MRKKRLQHRLTYTGDLIMVSILKKEQNKKLVCLHEPLLLTDFESAMEKYKTDSKFRATVDKNVKKIIERNEKEKAST